MPPKTDSPIIQNESTRSSCKRKKSSSKRSMPRSKKSKKQTDEVEYSPSYSPCNLIAIKQKENFGRDLLKFSRRRISFSSSSEDSTPERTFLPFPGYSTPKQTDAEKGSLTNERLVLNDVKNISSDDSTPRTPDNREKSTRKNASTSGSNKDSKRVEKSPKSSRKTPAAESQAEITPVRSISRNRLMTTERARAKNKKLKQSISEAVEKLFEKNPMLSKGRKQKAVVKEDILIEKERTINIDQVLKDVTAYVDVRDRHEDRSDSIILQLEKMGANIVRKLTRSVTHVVYQNGRKTSFYKAEEWKIFVVSVLWIESCQKTGMKQPECEFPAIPPSTPDPRDKKVCNVLSKFANQQRTNRIDSEKRKDRIDIRNYLVPDTPISLNRSTSRILASNTSIADLNSTPTNSFEKASRNLHKNSCATVGTLQHLLTSPTHGEKMFTSDDEWLSTQELKRVNEPLAKRLFVGTSLTHLSPQRRNISSPSLSITSCESNEKTEITKNDSKQMATQTNTEVKEKKCKRKSSSLKTLPSIVTTNLHTCENEAIFPIIKNLGGFNWKTELDETTTHVICGEKKRTLKLLNGMLRGCWILNKEWVFRSLEKGFWLEEENFELHDWFPTAQVNRLDCSVGFMHCQKIFAEAGPMFIANQSVPPNAALKEIISLAGGHVASCQRQAKICIGMHKKNVISVLETWILDSIMAGKMLPVSAKQYRMNCNKN